MKFSVLMSVSPDEKVEYLSQSLNSIWAVQSVKPNQVIIIKDGEINEDLSTIIERFKESVDAHVIVKQNEKNMGLAYSLNVGMKLSSYDIIARMDSDDISMPDRFKKQLFFMENNPDIVVMSSNIEEYDQKMEKILGVRRIPEHHEEIKKFAKKRNPISHPVSVFRKNEVMSVGGYPDFKRSQDYALWSLLLVKGYKMYNMQEVLLKMRTGTQFIKRRGLSYLINEILIIRYQNKIGFISARRAVLNIIYRIILRTSPDIVKQYLYKNIRG